MLQLFMLPSGGQVGTGRERRLLDATIVLAEAAEELCVEATAPVRARTTTKARTMVFMAKSPFCCSWKSVSSVEAVKILVDFPAEMTIRCVSM